MSFTRKAGLSLLVTLSIAALVSCGDAPGPSAPFRQATASDPSLPKGGVPLSALPSHVVSGEVGAFREAAADAAVPKSPDAAAALPSKITTGKSAVYAPDGRHGRPEREPPPSAARP